MSVKHSILAILASGPSFGYQLKKEFEELTVGIWPINDGQIYTTLARLQRDGLVEEIDEGEQKMVRLTDSGRGALAEWMSQTRPPATTDRDELTLKVAFALSRPGLLDHTQLLSLVDRQRIDATASLQRLTRLKARLEDGDLGQATVLDAAAQRITSELRWLDVVEQRIADSKRLDIGSKP